MAVDTDSARLFIGCDNKMMAVVDAKSGKVIATVPVGEGVDANRFDPGTRLAFSSNGDTGTLTVVHEDTPDKYTVVENVTTRTNDGGRSEDPQRLPRDSEAPAGKTLPQAGAWHGSATYFRQIA
jgi:hypothetical protein